MLIYDIYFFINQQLIKANIEKNKEIILECKELLKDLRSTWKQVIEINKKERNPVPGTDGKIKS